MIIAELWMETARCTKCLSKGTGQRDFSWPALYIEYVMNKNRNQIPTNLHLQGVPKHMAQTLGGGRTHQDE